MDPDNFMEKLNLTFIKERNSTEKGKGTVIDIATIKPLLVKSNFCYFSFNIFIKSSFGCLIKESNLL